MSKTKSGPCIYCNKPTSENPFWFDSPDEDMISEWCFYHQKCKKLSAIRLEDRAQKKLADNPNDKTLQTLARVFGRLCDKALEEK